MVQIQIQTTNKREADKPQRHGKSRSILWGLTERPFENMGLPLEGKPEQLFFFKQMGKVTCMVKAGRPGRSTHVFVLRFWRGGALKGANGAFKGASSVYICLGHLRVWHPSSQVLKFCGLRRREDSPPYWVPSHLGSSPKLKLLPYSKPTVLGTKASAPDMFSFWALGVTRIFSRGFFVFSVGVKRRQLRAIDSFFS